MSDLVPNQGDFYIPLKDEDEQQALSKERTEALQALPLLEDLITWFDKQADETDRMSNLDIESKLDMKSQVMAFQMLAELLKAKKGELQAIFNAYKPKQRK